MIQIRGFTLTLIQSFRVFVEDKNCTLCCCTCSSREPLSLACSSYFLDKLTTGGGKEGSRGRLRRAEGESCRVGGREGKICFSQPGNREICVKAATAEEDGNERSKGIGKGREGEGSSLPPSSSSPSRRKPGKSTISGVSFNHFPFVLNDCTLYPSGGQ